MSPPSTTAVGPGQAPSTPASRLARSFVGRLGFLTSYSGLIGATMVLVAVLVAIFASAIAPYDLDEQSLESFAAPSLAHLLGSDQVGRDIFSRLVYAVRLDLVLAFTAIPIGAGVGIVLGLFGVLSPKLGQLTARLFDVLLGFPTLVLGLTLAFIMGAGFGAVLVAIAVLNIPVFGRLARGGMLTQMSRDYIVAVQSLGATRWRILWRHILPNVSDGLFVAAVIAMADAVFIEGGLSILGVGIQPPSASLGSLLQSGLPYIQLSPLYVLAPTLALAWIILGFALLADAFNERANL